MSLPEKEPSSAWVALAACSFVLWLFGGVFRCVGLLYVELLDIYNQGPVITSTVQIVGILSHTCATPLSGYLAGKVPLRYLLMTTSCLALLGYMVAAFTNSFTGVIIGYSIIQSFAGGLTFIATILTVNLMFYRRRNLANGLLWASSSLGAMIMPPIYAYLIELYTIKGVFIILSGIFLHLLISAALLNPEKVEFLKRQAAKAAMTARTAPVPSVSGKIDKTAVISVKKRKPDSEDTSRHHAEGHVNMAADFDTPEGHISETDGKFRSPQQGYATMNGNVKPDKNRERDDYTMELEIEVQQKNETKTTETTHKEEHSSSTLNNLCSLFKQRSFWKLLFLTVLCNQTFLNIIVYLPAYADELGFTRLTFGYILTAGGCIELVFRVLIGYIADLKCTNSYVILGLCNVSCGLVTAFMVFLNLPSGIVVIVVIVSLCGNTQQLFISPLCIDELGPRKAGMAIGVYSPVSALLLSGGQYMLGWLREVVGSYSALLLYGSSVYVLSGALSLLYGFAALCSGIRTLKSKSYDLTKNTHLA